MGNLFSKKSKSKKNAAGAAAVPAAVMTTASPMKLDSSNLSRADFEFHEKLGSGQYADVYRATHKANTNTYAIKQMHKEKMSSEEIAGLAQEIAILDEVNHHSVMQFYGSWEEGGFLYLVTELLKGGELFDRIVAQDPPHYSEKSAQSCVRILVEAIAYLHSKGICHRDLKPENLILKSKDDNEGCKLADFGFAAKPSSKPNGVLTDGVGTPGYVAPEIILQPRHHGLPCDIWSLGVIVYILICGYPPFYHEDDKKLFRLITKGQYAFDPAEWEGVSDLCKDFINKMLVVDPKKRFTAGQLLEHEWMTSADVSDEHRGNAYDQLKKFKAKQRWKKAANTVIAVNRMKAFMNFANDLKEGLAEEIAKEEAEGASTAN